MTVTTTIHLTQDFRIGTPRYRQVKVTRTYTTTGSIAPSLIARTVRERRIVRTCATTGRITPGLIPRTIRERRIVRACAIALS